jgi:hypothetical protein
LLESGCFVTRTKTIFYFIIPEAAQGSYFIVYVFNIMEGFVSFMTAFNYKSNTVT